MRAPLLVSTPARKGNGKACRSLVEFVDIYPTLAELANLRPPANLEGQSFIPLLADPTRAWKSAAFSVVTAPDGIMGRCAVTDRYRYIRWTVPHPGEELYDRQSIPESTKTWRVSRSTPSCSRRCAAFWTRVGQPLAPRCKYHVRRSATLLTPRTPPICLPRIRRARLRGPFANASFPRLSARHENS